MTANAFRKLALAMPEATEQSHMGHPDFRVAGKIFATLGYPNNQCGMVKLTLDQRDVIVVACPKGFAAVPGGWGDRGATIVQLKAAPSKLVKQALEAAWRNTAPARLRKLHSTL